MHRVRWNARSGQRINFDQNRIGTAAATNRLMIAVTIVPARSPTFWPRLVWSTRRWAQPSFAAMANAAPANGSPSTRARDTLSQSLRGCAWTPRHLIATAANGRLVGTRPTGHRMASTPGIRSGCECTVVSAVLSGDRFAEPKMTRRKQRTLQANQSWLDGWEAVTPWASVCKRVVQSFELEHCC